MKIYSLFGLAMTAAATAIPISGKCQPEDSELLSNIPSSGYATVEAIQRHYCKRAPSHNCNFDAIKCRAIVEDLWQKMFNEKPTDEALSTSCRQISTRYELPGVYSMLSRIYGEIKAAAPSAGLAKVEGIRVGSLPIREINARVFTANADETPIILFNVRFFEFASELAKVSALSIPMRKSRGFLVIDGSKDALEKKLTSDRHLTFLFANRLMHFLDLEGIKQELPPENIQSVLVRYQEGIELFAFAHEYAHVALKHRGRTTLLEGDNVSAAVLGISGEQGNWIQEIEADYFAAKLLHAIFEQRTTARDAHIADPLLWFTPEFYFFGKDLVDSVLLILDGREDGSEPSAIERNLLAAVESCMQHADCNLSKTLHKFESVPNGHPHPQIRRALVEMVLRRPAKQNEGELAMQSLAKQMIRNAEYLGDEVRSALRNPVMRELVSRARAERASGSVK